MEGDCISIEMNNPTSIKSNIDLGLEACFSPLHSMNTGVPHAVLFVDDCETLDINKLGHAIRHHPYFAPQGTNFNGVQCVKDRLIVRTYERGVEGETLACGTGVTASALAAAMQFKLTSPVTVQVRSGEFLQVDFKTDGYTFTDVWLSGPAHKIFDGSILG
jgi:diaminopimelate epimerase